MHGEIHYMSLVFCDGKRAAVPNWPWRV